MTKAYQGQVKVDESVQPLLKRDRKPPELKIGSIYFVSFGSNIAYPCTLKEIINEYSETEVSVEILTKPQKSISYLLPGNKVKIKSITHLLKAIEIGLTPEHAARNCVFF